MKYILLTLCFLGSLTGMGQIKITLADAEKELQKNNLQLLAEQYNISASEAAVIQAKLWEQPYLSGELNMINPQNNKYLDLGNQGQKAVAIQQLIYLGGKKKNEVAFAKSNVVLAKLQFEQLLRNLKWQLEQTFFDIYFDRQKVGSLEIQITILDTLVNHYNLQAKKGNVPLKEVVRLQSLMLELTNNKNMLLKSLIESQQNLSILTGIRETIFPIVNETQMLNNFMSKIISKDSLLSYALTNNLEYQSAIQINESQELFLKWQKSLAIPDLTTGASYDQRGGAFQNQVNLTLGVPLPLWNKNKGNIKIAEAQLQQSNLSKEYKRQEIIGQVQSIYQMYLQQRGQLLGLDKSTLSNFETVYDGMIVNFKKRNITMIEFTDFMESYNQTVIQINEIKKSCILSGLNLNYITNKEIF